ncbi:threonine ammonia-lyase [Roseiterribacter gracilis]|uniref:threonine ammonia-lyase n=1 Tax=Roseiterribacter gracilis TaxID=2812848 RepID=UPI003B43A0BD
MVRAAQRLQGRVARTRTVTDGPFLRFKLETEQPTGAFKERGALNALLALPAAARAAGVVTVSAGNHGAAIARHATALGLRAVVVLPANAARNKVERVRSMGADVVEFGDDLIEARKHALDLAAKHRLTFVHPYDDADVIAGQGTVAMELLAAAPTVRRLIVPVGGGGLLAGTLLAVAARAPNVEVIGVALAGRGANGPTRADGIAVRALGKLPQLVVDRCNPRIVEVDEDAILDAMHALRDRLGVRAEGAGAASYAAIRAGLVKLDCPTGLVVSGGNVDASAF